MVVDIVSFMVRDRVGCNSLVVLPWKDKSDAAVGCASKFGMRGQPSDHGSILFFRV